MTRRALICIILISAATLPMQAFLAFGLWFSPGWANGWGMPQHDVWPAGLTASALILALTVVISTGAMASLCMEQKRDGTKQTSQWIPYAIWVAVGAVLAALACIALYISIRAVAIEYWP